MYIIEISYSKFNDFRKYTNLEMDDLVSVTDLQREESTFSLGRGASPRHQPLLSQYYQVENKST